MEKDFKGLLNFQVRRHANRNSKNLLVFLEDIKKEQELTVERAKLVLPKENHDILDQINILTSEKMAHIRKRILDDNGELVRDVTFELENYTVSIKIRNEE